MLYRLILIFLARFLDLILLASLTPILIDKFVVDYAIFVKFAVLSSVTCLILKLNYDLVIIRASYSKDFSPEFVFNSVVVLKLAVAIPLFLLSIAYLYIQMPLSEGLYLTPAVILVLLSEVFVSSQFTLLFGSHAVVLLISFARVAIFLLGSFLAIRNLNVIVLIYSYAISLLISSILYYLFNKRFLKGFRFRPLNFKFFFDSVKIFSLRLFYALSDKIVILIAAFYVDDNLIIGFDILFKIYFLLTVPLSVVFNYAKSRGVALPFSYFACYAFSSSLAAVVSIDWLLSYFNISNLFVLSFSEKIIYYGSLLLGQLGCYLVEYRNVDRSDLNCRIEIIYLALASVSVMSFFIMANSVLSILLIWTLFIIVGVCLVFFAERSNNV